MKLKSFKGMPHELGGIDYTEGAEVEGGEYAVKIGTSGNEYIFDKESSEGDFLAKEYKKLNSNSRLLEDDPIALATFEQIARDQALTHAQRSVNEKGVDPFRNMYEEGQAKNGGVKYATGGPVGYNMDESSEDRMRTTSFGDQEMRIEADTVNRKDIPAWKEAGLLMGDIFLGLPMASFTGKSFSETVMADSEYRSSESTRRAVGDDTMTGTAFGYGVKSSQNVISNMGTDVLGGMADGGALPKNKYAQGGASGQKDMYMGGGGSSGGGGGMPWIQIVKAVKGIKDNTANLVSPEIDKLYEDERYVDPTIGGPRKTLGGGSLGIPQKQPQEEEQGGLDPQYFDQEGNPWMMDEENQLRNMPVVSEVPMTEDTPIDFVDLNQSSTEGPMSTYGWKNGGAKKGVYGYYANGGGVDTLHSGITYQDLQGGRSYPVYDNNGNEIQGRRNIGASSLSPGFDIQENFIPRESTPQGYSPLNHDPYGNYDLNEENHFMHLRKPTKQSKLTRDLNAEQGFNLYADPVKNAPNVKSTSTLTNNETGKSRPLKKKEFDKGGVKETDPPMGPTGAPTGVAVSPTGNAYSSEYMRGRNKKRGVGSNDYGMIPANMEQYAYTFFGGDKPFTEADMTPEEYAALVYAYNIRKEPNTIGYKDWNKAGSSDINETSMVSKLTNKQEILRSLIGAAAVKNNSITSDYNFGNKTFLDIVKDPNLMDGMGWLHNNSPFVNKEAMAKKDAINIKMPKKRK